MTDARVRAAKLAPLISACLLTIAVAACREKGPPVTMAEPSDYIAFENGRIWTGNPAQPEAEGFIIRDGRFLRVGSSAEIL